MKLQGKIAVLKGGPGSEREVSLVSGRSVADALSGEPGLEVVEVDVRDAEFAIDDDVILAFNIIHGTFGEDGQVQRILEERGIPYTGAGVASSRLAFDKIASKERFMEAGVPTPAYVLWDLEGDSVRPRMPLPCVVKPPCEGSSVGVHIVREEDELAAAVEDVRRHAETAVVERFIEGRELTVGVLGDMALPIVHICPRSGFYDMRNKYPWLLDEGGTDYFVPADLPEALTHRVQRIALAAHRALGVEIYSRVDVLLEEKTGEPFVLEINTIPGMTESSLLPMAARSAGLDFADLCLRIAESSLALRGRSPAQRRTVSQTEIHQGWK